MANRSRIVTHTVNERNPSKAADRGDSLSAAEVSQMLETLRKADPEAFQSLMLHLGPKAMAQLLAAHRTGEEHPPETAPTEVMKRFVARMTLKTHPHPTSEARPPPLESAKASGRRGLLQTVRGTQNKTTALEPHHKGDCPPPRHDPSDQLEIMNELLMSIDPRLLVDFLRRETPAVAALALGLAPRELSHKLLKLVGTETGARILFALAKAEDASPSALDALRESLQELREESLSQVRLGRGLVGADRVAELLSGVDMETRKALLKKLEQGTNSDASSGNEANTLAKEVRKRLVTVVQIATLATRDLALIVSKLNEKEIALAILLEPDGVQMCFLDALSVKRRSETSEELAHLRARRGSIRKRDVDAAAEKLLDRAQELRDAGCVVFPWDEAMV